MRSRGNGRKLECCGEEVDSRGKERRGKSETGVIFTSFFFFFFSFFFFQERRRQVEAAMQGSNWGECGERAFVSLQECVP